MTRTTYLLLIHAGCLAMALPAGVIVVALRSGLDRAILWCSDRVSRRFVRRIATPGEPAGNPAGNDAKEKRSMKLRTAGRPSTRLPVGGQKRGMRSISPFMG